jgi:ethanolamine utilization protein EutP (predicted NTPase)
VTITAAIYGEKFATILAKMGDLLSSPAFKDTKVTAKYEQDLQDFRQRGFLTIAFVGEYSAGKSSLISALTGRRDLAISADIATDQCCEYAWSGVRLIDTPGLWTERKDHDALTYDTIAKSDLLVYCLTYSLFDTTTLANFKDLAFERNYQTKMLLLVNKMSAEAGDVEDRIRHYTASLQDSLAPKDLKKFPVAFCDARDQIDGEDECDEELKALSRFEILAELLNKFIDTKGVTARLDTPLRIVLSSLDDVKDACTRDDGRDDQQSHLLKKFTGVVTRQRRALSIKVEYHLSPITFRKSAAASPKTSVSIRNCSRRLRCRSTRSRRCAFNRLTDCRRKLKQQLNRCVKKLAKSLIAL